MHVCMRVYGGVWTRHIRYTSTVFWCVPACAVWSAGVNACVYVCIRGWSGEGLKSVMET